MKLICLLLRFYCPTNVRDSPRKSMLGNCHIISVRRGFCVQFSEGAAVAKSHGTCIYSCGGETPQKGDFPLAGRSLKICHKKKVFGTQRMQGLLFGNFRS